MIRCPELCADFIPCNPVYRSDRTRTLHFLHLTQPFRFANLYRTDLHRHWQMFHLANTTTSLIAFNRFKWRQPFLYLHTSPLSYHHSFNDMVGNGFGWSHFRYICISLPHANECRGHVVGARFEADARPPNIRLTTEMKCYAQRSGNWKMERKNSKHEQQQPKKK